MPFALVITREGFSDAVSAVPSNWVKGEILYWPKTNKKSEQEALRCNEQSIPENNWRQQKCRVKLNGIQTFQEALKLEEVYTNFEDTEEEQMFLYNKKNKKPKYDESSIDLNAVFEKATPKSSDKVKIISNQKYEDDRVLIKREQINDLQQIAASSSKDIQLNPDQTITYKQQFKDMSTKKSYENRENIKPINENTGTTMPLIAMQQISKTDFTDASTKQQFEDMSTKKSYENRENIKPINKNADIIMPLLAMQETSKTHFTDASTTNVNATQIDDTNLITNLITEHNKLFDENKILKESLHNFSKYHENVEHKFAAIKVRLDKIMSVLETKQNNQTDPSDDLCSDLKFPIDSLKDLNILEQRLGDKNLEKQLVRKFSKMIGTDGLQKVHKIGLSALAHIIKDECLSVCSWKGIKGCNKTPFLNYFNTREMIYKIFYLADQTCTLKTTDAFIQHSAIKHCNQRLKRLTSKLSSPHNEVREEGVDSVARAIINSIEEMHAAGVDTRPSSTRLGPLGTQEFGAL